MAAPTKGFKGNLLLRRAGVPPEGGYTPERLLEIQKCAEDPLYFFRTYVYIKHVDFEQKVLFDPRGYQERMLTSIIFNRNTISRWPRQSGKTTVLAGVALHAMLFNKNHSILIAAHKGDKARDIIGSIQDMYMELPSWLQQGIVEWNKGSFKLENGSRVRASTTSVSSARGDTYNIIMLDEFAFVPTHVAEEFLKSVIPTVSSGKDTKIIITSTPKGLNMFYRLWHDAVEGKVKPPDNYVPIAVEWNEVPGRDEAYRTKIILQFGQEFWDQEFACAFLGSSQTLISTAKLLSLVDFDPSEYTPSTRLYERPITGHIYACTVDVAEGLGGDSSVVMVFDITTVPYRPVFIFEDRYIDPMALPGMIHQVGRAFNDAMVLVESNFGQLTADILWRDFEYENVIFTARAIKNPGGQKVGWGGKQMRPGVQMNPLTKRVGCSNLKSLIENDQLIVNDRSTIEQLRRFAVKGKSYAAEEGHDDLVMCLVLFAWLADQGYVKDQNDSNIRGNIAEINRQKIEDNMLVTYQTTGNDAPEVTIDGKDHWLSVNTDPEPDPYVMDDLERFERWS
jgi:hypothetical protein